LVLGDCVPLACDGSDDAVVLGEVRRLRLECQLVRNRGALMVLAAGVSKGTGLVAGLSGLGISPHSAAAVGDAENDHSLLLAAEVRVAVGKVNVLVTGVPQRGESYVAGLIAEQLIRLGYCVAVMDPEGDHAGLGSLGSVLVTSGQPPPADTLANMARPHADGVVIGLSALSAGERAGYLCPAPGHWSGSSARRRSGLHVRSRAQGPMPQRKGTSAPHRPVR
jgi:haloacid dehalogenase-like hydrolase